MVHCFTAIFSKVRTLMWLTTHYHLLLLLLLLLLLIQPIVDRAGKKKSEFAVAERNEQTFTVKNTSEVRYLYL